MNLNVLHRALTSTTLNPFGMNLKADCTSSLLIQNHTTVKVKVIITAKGEYIHHGLFKAGKFVRPPHAICQFIGFQNKPLHSSNLVTVFSGCNCHLH